MPVILCCMCGIEITQNPTNMCVTCLRQNVDITADLGRQVSIHSCRTCKRFLLPPWTECALESKELMAACLRRIPGLNKLKLIDAAWIWTEPHSMRLKIKITVQKEVMNGAVLQQAAVVEFVVRNRQCEQCQASFAEGVWHAVVQVRQRVEHKRTFYYLEQLLLKHEAHSECINIVTFRDGMDFFFMQRQQAMRFISFLEAHVPLSKQHSRKLVSADNKSNEGNFKENYFVEIVPLCKDDLVLLPRPMARALSDISQLVLVKGVGASAHVIDPVSNERQEISSERYWHAEHRPVTVMTSRSLVRFVVLSVEPVLHEPRACAKKRGGNDRRPRLAECVLMREADLGVTDQQYSCVTHLGYILREGDVVLGYDLTRASWVQDCGEENIGGKKAIPDVVLVRKYYGSQGARKWALRELEVEQRQVMTAAEEMMAEKDLEEFMQELEGDREMRAKINLYKARQLEKQRLQAKSKKNKAFGGGAIASEVSSVAMMENDDVAQEIGDDDSLDEEQIRVEELLDELTINVTDESADD
jgi:nonsense-mediated mRNA decay protein 3